MRGGFRLIIAYFMVVVGLFGVGGTSEMGPTSLDALLRCFRDVVPSLRWDNDARTWADRAGSMTNPLVVVYPSDGAEVGGVLTCADAVNTTYRAVSGRHFYQPIDDAMVVIDVQGLCKDDAIVVDLEQGVMTVPSGCPNGRVLGALPDGFLFPMGNCPTVGLGGYMLGGGMSDVSRYTGMGCDTVQSLTRVTVDPDTGVGVEKTTSDAEVLYRACGGGAGPESRMDGVVTAFTVKLVPTPTDIYSRITVLASKEKTPDALVALQEMLQGDDARYFKFGGGGVIGVLWEYDIGLVLNLLYLGPGSRGVELLREAGIVNDTWSSTMVDEYGSFRDAMSVSMVQEGIGTDMEVACELFACDQFTGLVMPEAASAIAEMLQDLESPLLNKESDLWQTRQFAYPVPGFMLRTLGRDTWERVTEVATTPLVGPDGTPLCSRHYALLAHFTGGQVAARDASASAYPWREDTVLLTWLNGMDPAEAAACDVEAARYDAALAPASLNRAYANYRGSGAYNVTYVGSLR